MEEKNTGITTIDSTAITNVDLISDITHALKIILNTHIKPNNKILFYIEGTNGYLFISAFDYIMKDFSSDIGVCIELPILWENTMEDADEFENFVLSSIKKSLKSEIGKTIKLKYELYYQNVVDDRVKF